METLIELLSSIQVFLIRQFIILLVIVLKIFRCAINTKQAGLIIPLVCVVYLAKNHFDVFKKIE